MARLPLAVGALAAIVAFSAVMLLSDREGTETEPVASAPHRA